MFSPSDFGIQLLCDTVLSLIHLLPIMTASSLGLEQSLTMKPKEEKERKKESRREGMEEGREEGKEGSIGGRWVAELEDHRGPFPALMIL